MKRSLVAVILILIAMSFSILCSCGFHVQYTAEDREKIAKEKFGIDKIICVAFMDSIWGFTVDGTKIEADEYDSYVSENEFSFYYVFVLGEKDGEETAVIFPQYR